MPVVQQPAITVNVPMKAFLPKYHHLIKRPVNMQTDIDILYGGRDSGKSEHVAMMLVIACMSLPFFRCVLVRKVFNSIKESQWQTIKDVCVRWGVDHLFVFNQSPLEIRCVNGNKFVCRGMDDPGNVKSIKDFNFAWIEEGNQISLDDFILLMTSLRKNDVRVKTFITFNPETDTADFNDFWIYNIFYSGVKDLYKTFTEKWLIAVDDKPVLDPKTGKQIEFVYSSTHSTYLDNKYCDGARIAFYSMLKKIDPYHYSVYTLGHWHNKAASDPFCYCFDSNKHIGVVPINAKQEVYLSFDFNINPITCGVYQHSDKNIKVVESIKLENSDIYKLCDHIKAKYSKYLLIVTGDATGRNSSALAQDGINYYTVIKSKLDLSNNQLKVPSVNPPVKENRVLVNAVLYTCNVTMDKTKAKDLIYDCQNVSVDSVGDIDKGTRANPKKRADHLDNFRYYLNTFHKNVLKTP